MEERKMLLERGYITTDPKLLQASALRGKIRDALATCKAKV
jgi:hypothetical protein